MDIKQSLKQMKILHGTLFTGVLLFAVVSIVIRLVLEPGAEFAILPEQAFSIFEVIR